MPLNARQVETAKSDGKLVKLSDGGGLQLWLMPNGSKLWRLAYRHGGKQKLLALGAFPVVTLADARQRREQHRKTIEKGLDPAILRKQSNANTFGAMADEWLALQSREGRAKSTITKNTWLLDFARPFIGARPIAEISAAEVLAVLKDIDAAGRRESARRARSIIGAVFRYAVVEQKAETDPTAALAGGFKADRVKHRAALTSPGEFGALLRAIWGFEGQQATVAALRLSALLVPRPGELRHAEWSEFDLEEKVWSVPEGRMKMRRPHFVPLPTQALDVLTGLKRITERGNLLFPSLRDAKRPISDNTLNAALRRLGYSKEQATVHGFRASFSTMANEAKLWSPDAIERHLSHTDRDATRRAYARGAYWEERVKLAQWWADQCDTMRLGAEVLPFRRGA